MILVQGPSHPVGNAVFGAILGTAVGFAGAIFDIYAVFAALGIGMLPFLVIALYPAVLGTLLKPGPWMGRLSMFWGCPGSHCGGDLRLAVQISSRL